MKAPGNDEIYTEENWPDFPDSSVGISKHKLQNKTKEGPGLL